MDITDIVLVKATGRSFHVSGFYKFHLDDRGCNNLVPCMPYDPLCIAVRGRQKVMDLHLPMDLEYQRPQRLTPSQIEEERAYHRWKTEEYVSGSWIEERWHPQLLRRFQNLSNHQQLALQEWRMRQARLFASGNVKISGDATEETR